MSLGHYRHITLELQSDGVLLATLNRPERLNAVNEGLHEELARLPVEVEMSREVNVLVLAGSGRAFCAGADFTEPMDVGPTSLAFTLARRLVDTYLACEKPLIAAVQGAARGLGVTIALLCDVVFAQQDATFADTHVLLEVGAGDGGQLLWPLLVGPSRAKYFLMTGDVVTAAEAERIGLVHAVVDGPPTEPALELAHRLGRGPQTAVRASKVAVNAQIRSLAAWAMPLGLSAQRYSVEVRDHVTADTETHPGTLQ